MTDEHESGGPSDPGGPPGEDGPEAEGAAPGGAAPGASSPRAREPVIVAQGLTKYYGERAAIKDLSFEIDEGEVVGFLGLNGAGKTTTLRVLSCLLVPTTGSVRVAGLDALERPHDIRKRIGYLPEVPPLYHEMTVRAFLDFAARLRGVSGAEVGRRLERVLSVTRIEDVAGQVIGTLSAGYRQRVGIAQAVVHEPELLILDEPFAGLDPLQTVEMRKMIRELGGEHTVLLSSHNLPQIHETCDRILLVQKGRIVASGTEAELAANLGMRQERFAIEVRGSSEAIAAALATVGGVESHEVERLDGELARVLVRAAADIREEAAAALVGGGVGLRSLGRVLPELETVFVELARDDRGEEVVSP